MSTDNLNELDWRMNFDKRVEIVELAKSKKLNFERVDRYEIPSRLMPFPYLQSESVDVVYWPEKSITVKFLVDAGLLDNSSSFVYTDNPEEIKKYDKLVSESSIDYKKAKNWYFVKE
ncbi:MAG: hypothetical protein EOO46_13295 [Flavobacterium sp.]|nr:MAG: hypothetical protein EOO46_13295 [Flavobacterium sp.]